MFQVSKFMPFGVLPELLGCRQDGSPIWLFRGGAPQDDDTGSNGGDSGAGSGKADGDDDSEGEGSAGSDADDEGADDEDADVDLSDSDKTLPENIQAILKKNRRDVKVAEKAKRAAEKLARDAAAKVQTFEDKDKTELQLAQDKLQRAEEKATALEAQLAKSARRTAFLQVQGFNWADAEDALDMAMKLGLKDLEVDEDGRVDTKKVKAVAKKLADEKPYMVVKDDAGGGSGRRTGGSFNSGGGNGKGVADENKLKAKYPSMAGRRRVAG